MMREHEEFEVETDEAGEAPIPLWSEAGGGGVVFEFNSATSSSNPARFTNLRAEAFWELRTLLEDGQIALPPDEKLAEELSQSRWHVVPSSGAIRIEPKDDLKSRLGHSPDRADAVAI